MGMVSSQLKHESASRTVRDELRYSAEAHRKSMRRARARVGLDMGLMRFHGDHHT